MNIHSSFIANYNYNRNLDRSNMTKITEVNNKLTSGRKYDQYHEISNDGKTGIIFNLQQSIDNGKNHITKNKMLSDENKYVSQTIDKVLDLANEFRYTLSTSKMSNKNEILVALRSQLSRIVDRLNSKFDGRYIFSGNKSDTRPVILNTQQNFASKQEAENIDYYQGDHNSTTLYISDSVKISKGIAADQRGFKGLINTLNGAIYDFQHDSVDKASTIAKLNKAIDGIYDISKESAYMTTTIDKVNQELKSNQSFFEAQIKEIMSSDVLDLSVKLQDYSTVLTASFYSKAKIDSLMQQMINIMDRK